jgi:outer membrane protein
MKSLLLAVVIIFFSFFNIVNAKNSIVFIDLDTVLTLSKPGANILKQLNILKNKDLKDFEKKEKLLKENEKKIIKQKNILSNEDFQLKVKNLKNEIKEYNKYRDDKIKIFNKTKVDNTNKLLKLINPVVLKYTKDESISMVLKKKNLIFSKPELDITNLIITIVNKNIKEFKIK